MKIISVNNTDVQCSHEVKVGKNHQTEIHLTVSASADGASVSMVHVFTVGLADGPLPSVFGPAEIQSEFDAFRKKHAEVCESKLRSKKLAASIV
jgi:hypothetical protein